VETVGPEVETTVSEAAEGVSVSEAAEGPISSAAAEEPVTAGEQEVSTPEEAVAPRS